MEHSHISLFVSACHRRKSKKKNPHSRLPPRVKKHVANHNICDSQYVESLILGITNICDFLPIGTDVTYDHFLGRNHYISKRSKRQRCTFPLAFLSSALVGVIGSCVERIGKNKTAQTMDFSAPILWACTHTRRSCLLCSLCVLSKSSLLSLYCHFVFMAPIPPSRRQEYQFRAEELNNLLDSVERFLPISQAVANVHLENYCWEVWTTESLRHKFQEIARRTSPTCDPNCPDYVIKAKQINRQLAEMIDALSGGSVACPMALILMAQGPVSLPMSLTAKPL